MGPCLEGDRESAISLVSQVVSLLCWQVSHGSFQETCEEAEEAWGREAQCCQLVPQVGNMALVRIVTYLFTEGVHQGGKLLYCSLFSQPVSE